MVEPHCAPEALTEATERASPRNFLVRFWASLSAGGHVEHILIQDSFIHPELLTRF